MSKNVFVSLLLSSLVGLRSNKVAPEGVPVRKVVVGAMHPRNNRVAPCKP